MITTRGETYELQLFRRVENSAYEFEDKPSAYFYGRPANQMEKREYRIMQGVNGDSTSIYVLCSNLPKDIKIKDRVYFLGKVWSVESVGYYYENNRVVNGKVFSNEYLIERSPKGLNLQ